MAVDFDTRPDRYRHWSLLVEGEVARLLMDVDEDCGISPGYTLKQNSYDLGVEIELGDAVRRLRFEHPEVRVVVVSSRKERMFCAGANIGMLAGASHPWKVNFCKFSNEVLNDIEDSPQHWIAALNGPAAGGGYEIALACDEILLVDDGSSAVSMPEVPLLGVLPGTGGLTRLVDKRHVRRDLADVLATRTEGVRGATAVEWGLVDAIAPPRRFDSLVEERIAAALAGAAAEGATGITLGPLQPEYVSCEIDRSLGTANIVVKGPADEGWLLAVAREMEDLILRLRFDEPEAGTWVFRTTGDPEAVVAADERILAATAQGNDWLADETIRYYQRTLKRLDVTSRSIFALIEPGSCFAGSLAELALAADRTYMLGDSAATLTLTGMNLRPLPMGNGLTRLATRFLGHDDLHDAAAKLAGRALTPEEAYDAGLVTYIPDDLDWDDEIRLALEERAAFSPDALTGMEASLRFAGPETTETKIFARLSAWQNWIFQRPNAAGPEGALRRYGSGRRPAFDRKRV